MLALVAVAAAAPIAPYPFTPCGVGHVSNISIDVTPDPPVKGANVTISVSGAVDETVNGGTYQIDVTYVGIPIYSKTAQICKVLTVRVAML